MENASEPEILPDLRGGILQSMGRALIEANRRLVQSQTESTFRDPEDRKATIEMVKLMPRLLDLLEAELKRAPPIAVCPACMACGAPPGQHWAHDCPRITDSIRGQLIFDYQTLSIFERNDLGEPAPRSDVTCQEALEQWLRHNRLTREQFRASVSARQTREKAVRLIEHAQTARICAERCDDRNSQAAAQIAGSIAAEVVALLDPHGKGPANRQASHDTGVIHDKS